MCHQQIVSWSETVRCHTRTVLSPEADVSLENMSAGLPPPQRSDCTSQEFKTNIPNNWIPFTSHFSRMTAPNLLLLKSMEIQFHYLIPTIIAICWFSANSSSPLMISVLSTVGINLYPGNHRCKNIICFIFLTEFRFHFLILFPPETTKCIHVTIIMTKHSGGAARAVTTMRGGHLPLHGATVTSTREEREQQKCQFFEWVGT